MPDIRLSQNADKTLNIIYKKYLSRKNDTVTNTYHTKLFSINSLFPNSDNNEIMPSLIELSKNKIIRLFSDRRLVLNDIAISYIENRNHFID